MRRISAYIFILCFAALTAAALPASPGAAFGLSIGPFHLGLPLFGHRHRFFHRGHIALHREERGARVYDRASLHDKGGPDHEPNPSAKANLPGPAPAQGADQAPLYPAAALPGLFDAVFWPAQSPQWPFGYDAIFRSAFTKSLPGDAAAACQQPDRTGAILGRIRAELRPTRAQLPLLQKLGEALGMTAAYLAKACPQAIPPQPLARLQLMESQLQTLTMAIDLVRPPLQQFQQSLDARQKAKFAAAGAPKSEDAGACGSAPTATDWSVDEITQLVQPGDSQRKALSNLKQTFASIADDLYDHCPNPPPPTPLARLEALEARLDASWRAALSLQVALAQFESELNDQQRGRLEAMNLAEAR